MTFPSTETLLPLSADRLSNSLVLLFRMIAVNRLLGKALSKFRNTRLGRKLTWATTPVTVTCLPILAAAWAVPMVRGMAFVSSARLWMTVAVRQNAAVRTANSFIGPAGCVRPGGDSRAKWRQTAPCKAASRSPDREPSRLAARRNKSGCLKNQNVREPSPPLRTGTVHGPSQNLIRPWVLWQGQGQCRRAQAPWTRWLGAWECLKRAHSSQASGVWSKARLERPSSVLLR